MKSKFQFDVIIQMRHFLGFSNIVHLHSLMISSTIVFSKSTCLVQN